MERQSEKQSRGRDTRWEEEEKGGGRWWSYNKRGGRGKRAHLERWGGKQEIKRDGRRDGDSAGASNVPLSWHQPLVIQSASLCCTFSFFCPYLHFSPFSSSLSSGLSHFSPLPLSHSPSAWLLLSLPLFGRSLKGGHGGDNANTGPLNREWEEDSCWR